MPGKVNPTQCESLTMIACQVWNLIPSLCLLILSNRLLEGDG